MLKGRPQKIEWRNYQVRNFRFPVELPNTDHDWECGSMALYALTKIKFDKIMKLSNNGHWSTKTMVDFLHKNKYTVIPVTIGNTVDAYESDSKSILDAHHVLLVGQKFFRYTNSWSVIHHNVQYHSGDFEILDPLNFINYPIEECYLIWHPSWK